MKDARVDGKIIDEDGDLVQFHSIVFAKSIKLPTLVFIYHKTDKSNHILK